MNSATLSTEKFNLKISIHSFLSEHGSKLAFLLIYLLLYISTQSYNEEYNLNWPLYSSYGMALLMLIIFCLERVHDEIVNRYGRKSQKWSESRWALFWILPLLPFAILNSTVGTYSINNPWLDTKPKFELVVDGVPITDNNTRWLIPSRHDIEKVPLNQSVNEYMIATTKDGLPIRARVSVDLRRADNPKSWKDPARYEMSLSKIIEARFKEICAATDSSFITPESLQISFQLFREGKRALRENLPPNVQLNGLVKVSEVTAFQKE